MTSARPQTVLADIPFTRSAARRLSWDFVAPRRPKIRHRHSRAPNGVSIERRESKFNNVNLDPGLRRGRTTTSFGHDGRVTTGSPLESPSNAASEGAVGEDCLSGEHKLNRLRPKYSSREFRSRLHSRVAQGTPKGATTLGSPSFAYFSWRSKKSE